MASKLVTPQIQGQLTKIFNELILLKDKRLDQISEWFEKRVAGVPRSVLLQVLVQFYYYTQLRGPDKAAERIIVHFCIFSLIEPTPPFDNFTFAKRDQDINHPVAVLLKCYNAEFRKYDPTFALITNAERQFIGRILGYTIEQRRILLLDETPEKLAKVVDDDPFNCYVASLLGRSTTADTVKACFDEIGLKSIIPTFPTPPPRIQPSPNITQAIFRQPPLCNVPSSTSERKRNGEETAFNMPRPHSKIRTESQQDIIESAETFLADYDSNHEPHFNVRADSGVHDCETINAENAIDELFNGSFKNIKHEELENLKNYFEKDGNLGILKTYNISLERMNDCVIAFPKMMGSALAYMLASNDERVYSFLNHMMHEHFSATTMVAMVQMFVETFRRGLQLDPKFVDSTLTCCMDFLDSDSAIKVTKSDDARIVRLVIYYIHIFVIYMPDAIAHRFGEIMNIIPNYSYIRTAPITYNKILQHQRKYGTMVSLLPLGIDNKK